VLDVSLPRFRTVSEYWGLCQIVALNGSVLALTFQSLAVSLRTTRFNIQKFYIVLALR
jgi:hypothetical protein